MADDPAVEVHDDPPAQRYEVTVDGQAAGLVAYEVAGGVVTMTHTEIDGAYGGRGLGSTLIKAALDGVRARGMPVVPACPFVRSYIERHLEYLDMVPPGLRAEFGLPAGEPPPR